MPDHAGVYTQRVYYSDTDAGGIVYHARYLDMTEHARTEFLRELGGDQAEKMASGRIGFVVSSLTIDFKKPAYLDDLLTVTTDVTSCARFSMNLVQRVYRDDELLTEQKTRVGCIDLDRKRPVQIPEQWRAYLAAESGARTGA